MYKQKDGCTYHQVVLQRALHNAHCHPPPPPSTPRAGQGRLSNPWGAEVSGGGPARKTATRFETADIVSFIIKTTMSVDAAAGEVWSACAVQSQGPRVRRPGFQPGFSRPPTGAL